MSNIYDDIRDALDTEQLNQIRQIGYFEERKLTEQLLSHVNIPEPKNWKTLRGYVQANGTHVTKLDDPSKDETTLADISKILPNIAAKSVIAIWMTSNEAMELPAGLISALLIGVMWKPSADELVLTVPDASVLIYINEDGDVFRLSAGGK